MHIYIRWLLGCLKQFIVLRHYRKGYHMRQPKYVSCVTHMEVRGAAAFDGQINACAFSYARAHAGR